MRSQVGWALLGLIIQRPSYGYELTQRFERTYGDAIELSSRSQIYNSLDALSGRGLIEGIHPDGTTAVGEERQHKLHYRATPCGARHYQEWVMSLAREQRRGSRLLAHQLAVLEPGQALAVLSQWESAYLEEARTARLRDAGQPGRRNGLVARLQQEEYRLLLSAALSWIDYARQEIKGLLGETRGKHS